MKKHLHSIQPLVLLVLMTFSTTVWSQDIHYTNFGFSPLNINPALTGVFNGDMRVTGNFRSQWQGVPVSYVTFSGSYDMKVPTKSKETFQPWRVGTFISYDHAGYSRLNNAGIYLAGSYMYPLSKSDFLSAGISAGMNQRAFKTSDLTWDDQYVARRFDPNIQSMDATIFDETIYYPDLSAGLNYHHQLPKSRSGLDIGFGYFHINEPKKSFKGEPALKCGARYTLYGSTNIKLNDFFDVMVDAMGQWQDKHREFVYGLGGRIYLVDKHTKQIALQAGVHMRNGDAVSPHVGLIYNNWKVAVNFDSNFSPFKAATNRLGGPEINLIYIFAKVPPAQYCPLCPTYL